MKKYNYATSKDYHKLYQHLISHPDEVIVCFLKEKEKDNYVQICYVKNRVAAEYVEVGCLGTCWIIATNIEEFVQSREEYQIEYIKSTTMK